MIPVQKVIALSTPQECQREVDVTNTTLRQANDLRNFIVRFRRQVAQMEIHLNTSNLAEDEHNNIRALLDSMINENREMIDTGEDLVRLAFERFSNSN